MNKLNFTNKTRLAKWIEENKEAFDGRKWKLIAQVATTDLGFTVNDTNIMGLVYQAFPELRKSKKKPKPEPQEPKSIEERIERLERQFAYLATNTGLLLPQ